MQQCCTRIPPKKPIGGVNLSQFVLLPQVTVGVKKCVWLVTVSVARSDWLQYGCRVFLVKVQRAWSLSQVGSTINIISIYCVPNEILS